MVSTIAVADEAAAGAPVMTQWVVFRCAGDRFGMPLGTVLEIMAPRAFTRLPGTGAAVCGLVNVRGRVTTVVDLGVLLRGQPSSAVAEHRLLLLDLVGRRLGAAVDQIDTITTAELDAAGAAAGVEAGDIAGCSARDAVMGTGRIEDGTFVALDPARLLEHLLA